MNSCAVCCKALRFEDLKTVLRFACFVSYSDEYSEDHGCLNFMLPFQHN